MVTRPQHSISILCAAMSLCAHVWHHHLVLFTSSVFKLVTICMESSASIQEADKLVHAFVLLCAWGYGEFGLQDVVDLP
jgi:hypothetical protein